MKYWYWFIQGVICWPVSWVLIRLFYRVEIRGRENLKGLSGPLIIASNHKTLMDTFLIGLALPFASRLFPLRFMTEELSFRGPVLEFLRKTKLLKLFYLLVGGFPSYRGEGIEKAIRYPSKLLQEGGTVLMFPEGGLVRGEGLGSFFSGAAALAIKSGALILPVLIQPESRKIIVSIGETFKLNAPSVERGTTILREKIANLSNTPSIL